MDILENFNSLSINDIDINMESEYIVNKMNKCNIDKDKQESIQEHDIHMKNDIDLYKQFEQQLETDLFQNNFDVYDNNNIYCRKLCLDVPNKTARGMYIDDEDYIHSQIELPTQMHYNLFELQTFQDYAMNFILSNHIIINYNEIIYSSDNIYAKTLYIYQFVNYYYTTLSSVEPQQRIFHLPNDMLFWTDNLITLIKTGLNNNLITYNMQNIYSKLEYINIKEDYFNELLYGLNLGVCHLKMIVNHCKIRKHDLWSLENIYIDKYFRVLNNLCIIIIFMKNS